MKNRNRWTPSKYVYRNGRLRASKDRDELAVSSRLVADLTANAYDRHLPTYATGRLLDLGCGKAPLFGAYERHVGDVVCVDWADSRHAGEYVDRECDLNEALPFRDGEFDTIVLSDVLEHIARPEALWGEMSRILAPGGRVLLNVPFLYCVHEAPHDFYRYTEHALRHLAESAGFRVAVLGPLGGTPEIAADLLAKHLCVLPVCGGRLASVIQGVVGAFVRTSPGRKMSERTASRFPLGYFMVAEKAEG
ncbi:class I SAM-dependent methyltransferase [Candidatus Sumerlaeota bacterium]|nr:class I SAM-dependent methyltransferase [Candidatus Sumerlaeota bacterium]